MKRLASGLLLLPALLLGGTLQAGVGPETTLLVVNADSPLSLTVANRWMALRPIPQNHVVWLHDLPGLGTVSMEAYRERILRPVLARMESLGLEGDIDTIVYSADFPYAVKLREEVRHNGLKYNRYIGHSASLTSLTFFAHQAIRGTVDYLAPQANHYFRKELMPLAKPGSGKALAGKALEQEKRASKLLEKGNHVGAARLLEPLVSGHPGSTRLHLLLARALAGSGKGEAAMVQLGKLPGLGYRGSLSIRNLEEFKALRQTPEFTRLMEKLDRPERSFEAPRGFRSRYHWNRDRLTPNDDDRYFLSASLAFTGERGNSLPEILSYLKRSAQSDFSHPRGTVYLMENRNVRTETRQPWFAETCRLLNAIGHACEILVRGRNGEDGILPRHRRDIIGLSAGYRTFHWEKSGSIMLPGAIAEALTSYGGDFDNRVQTKLTHFLRHGASVSSGAVSEPYAFAEKFPLPLLHYYYALGYAAAEAWYMAVASPYQVILVGDPLTRPHADALPFEFRSTGDDKPWRGTLTLAFRTDEKKPVDHFELWIDGRHVRDAGAGEAFSMDSTGYDDGYHRLHLVAVEKSHREGRTTRVRDIRVDNHGLSTSLLADSSAAFFGDELRLQGDAPSGSQVEIRQGSRVLASTTSERGRWQAALSTIPLGMGKVELRAVAITNAGQRVRSKPLMLSILPPEKRQFPRGRAPEGEPFEVRLVFRDQAGKLKTEHKKLKALNGRLKKLVPKRATPVSVEISGNFHVRRPGFYQLTLRVRGPLEIQVDGSARRMSAAEDHQTLVHLPLFLEPGWHTVRILPSPESLPGLKAVIAGEEAPRLLGTAEKQPRKKKKRR